MPINQAHLNLGGGRLYQFANKSSTQMMSYLIETPDGRLVMIDGGHRCDEDADFLESILLEKGGHIAAWFITHAHDDHYGALLRLLERGELRLHIDCLYFDFPPAQWCEQAEAGTARPLTDFLAQLDRHGLKTAPIGRGDHFDWGVGIEVLNSLGDYTQLPSINDTGLVLLAHFPKRDVLFLGDMAEIGQKALADGAADRLRCDIVQMAHHGQQGVNFALYRLISPKICLWPAPDWLWNNDNGGGFDSGPWRTVETRRWAEQLGVQVSFPAAFGDYVFD